MQNYTNVYDLVFDHHLDELSRLYSLRVDQPLDRKANKLFVTHKLFAMDAICQLNSDFSGQMKNPQKFITQLLESSDDFQFNYHMSKDTELRLEYKYNVKSTLGDIKIIDASELDKKIEKDTRDRSKKVSADDKEYIELHQRLSNLRDQVSKLMGKNGFIEQTDKLINDLVNRSKIQSIPVNIDITYRLTGLNGYVNYKFKTLGTLTKQKDSVEMLDQINRSISGLSSLKQEIDEFNAFYKKFANCYNPFQLKMQEIEVDKCISRLINFKKMLELDDETELFKELLDFINQINFEYTYKLTNAEMEYLKASRRKQHDPDYFSKLNTLDASLFWVRRLQAIIDLDDIGPRQLIVSSEISTEGCDRLASLNIEAIRSDSVVDKINPSREAGSDQHYIQLSQLAKEYRKVGLDASFAKEIVAIVDPVKDFFKQSMGKIENSKMESLFSLLEAWQYLACDDDLLEDLLKAQQKRIKDLVSYCQDAVDDLYPKYVKFKQDLELI